MKTYNTVAIQTDINGVDSNEELTALFAKALELCQTAKTSQEICCSSPPSTQYLSSENGTECTTIKAEMDDSEYLESMEAVCAQVKQEITDAREEAINNNYSANVVELDEDEESTSHLDKDVTTPCAEEKIKCCVCDEVYISQEALNQHMTTHEGQAAAQENLDQNNVQQGRHPYQIMKRNQSMQCLSSENGTECTTIKAEMDDHEYLESMEAVYSQIKQEITDVREEALRNRSAEVVETDEKIAEDEDEVPTSHLDKDVTTSCTEEKIKCCVCDEVYVSQEALNQHMTTHEGQAVTQENLDQNNVQQERDTTQKVERKKRKKRAKKLHICPYCNKECNSASNLKTHVRTHTKEKPYQCQHCDRTFTTSNALKIHTRRIMGIKPFKCSFCEKGFVTASEFKTHLEIHTGEEYKCEFCGKVFVSKSNFVKHQQIHIGEKSHKCEICGKAFVRKVLLARHLRTHTGEKTHKCDICNRTFTEKFNLVKHLRTHTGERPYKCDICDSTFAEKSNLVGHVRIHTGERPYKCDLCNKAFAVRSNLVKHKRIHTGEKPHKCDLCNKAFTTKSNLVKHKRVHTGEKPYKCDICNKTFTEKINVVKHLRTHTGERPYKCEICEKEFAQKGGLDQHLRTHSDERPYNCDICYKAFAVKSNLVKHKKIHIGGRQRNYIYEKAFGQNST